MANLSAYILPLKQLESSVTEYSFHLDDAFYKSLEQTDILGGSVDATVTVKKMADSFRLEIAEKGEIQVQCQRCLEPMTLPVAIEDSIAAKFGEDKSEETDELIIVDDWRGELNIAWLLFELAALTIPIIPTHEEGECDPEMVARLAQYAPQEDDDTIDPRWEKLKTIINN